MPATGQPTCPVCGAQRAKVTFGVTTSRRFDYHQCATCGLAYAWPRPTPAELDALYGADYFEGDSGFGYVDYSMGQINAERMWSYASMWSPIPFDSTRRVMLDIGCATGEFAAAAARHGWEAWGCEPSPAAASARDKGVRTVADVSDPSLPEGSFGLVTAFDVIEHVIDPLAFLADIRRLIAADGALLVETDNWATLGRRVKGVNWAQIQAHPPPEHINYFTVGALTRALRAGGFTPVRVDTPHGGPVNRAIASILQGRPVRTLTNTATAHLLGRLHLGANIRVVCTPT